MESILELFYDPTGVLLPFIQTNSPDTYFMILQRFAEASCVIYILIFVLFVFLMYRIFRSLWKF